MPRPPGSGRPRKSVEEHIRNGTYRPGKHGPRPGTVEAPDPANVQPEPPPDMPADLTVEQAAVWLKIVPSLAGRLKAGDVPTLTDLCRWVVRLGEIDAKLAAMEVGEKGYNGLLIAAGIATTNYDRLASKFGMSPVDRGKLRVVEPVAAKPKVKTRQPTRLDREGAPK